VNGIFAEPLFLCFDELSEPRSVEEILRQHFQQMQPAECVNQIEPCDTMKVRDGAQPASASDQELQGSSAQRGEHLSMLARWFYSKPRAGEILFRDADWPYRRILRACARVLAATQETP
jgi:hypothetical protein